MDAMEYQVPQFIEVEDKIVGPLTLRQFIYLAGGAGLCVIFFLYLPLWLALPLMALVAGGAGALAFYRINGKPLIEMVEAGFNYSVRSKLFLWKHEDAKVAPAKKVELKPQAPVAAAPRLSRGKLSELAWSLDVKKPSVSELES
ncbi:MAG: PrgI family protein [Patescibacteria group bacterium]|nr:PrgI family protein [Patescibacteria group bacterium]MDE1944071.1 PrgI family protein [Patescibacteria group bacterium]MDE1944732.1 PrgI family protein [Patescibacteria group bacterium]MDE2057276.1 PrgI family protein [Patescibacteria group bacterium]